MSQSRDRLIRQFQREDYRHGYSESFFDTLIAAQIRALRKHQKWTQAELGDKTGTTQSGISAFESSDYSRWSVATLRKFARAFDVALEVRFVSFAEALNRAEQFDGQMVFVPSFTEDLALGEVPRLSATKTEEIRTRLPSNTLVRQSDIAVSV